MCAIHSRIRDRNKVATEDLSAMARSQSSINDVGILCFANICPQLQGVGNISTGRNRVPWPRQRRRQSLPLQPIFQPYKYLAPVDTAVLRTTNTNTQLIFSSLTISPASLLSHCSTCTRYCHHGRGATRFEGRDSRSTSNIRTAAAISTIRRRVR